MNLPRSTTVCPNFYHACFLKSSVCVFIFTDICLVQTFSSDIEQQPSVYAVTIRDPSQTEHQHKQSQKTPEVVRIMTEVLQSFPDTVDPECHNQATPDTSLCQDTVSTNTTYDTSLLLVLGHCQYIVNKKLLTETVHVYKE